MTALGKLFRTTVFKLSLVYLVLFSLGAAVMVASVGYRIQAQLDDHLSQLIDEELQRLLRFFEEGGIRSLNREVRLRTQMPEGFLLLVTSFGGDYLEGNIAPSPSLPTISTPLMEAPYRRLYVDNRDHLGLMRVVVLPGDFRLLVGHDAEEHLILDRILRRGLGASLLWLVSIGTLGGLFVAHRMLERVDMLSASARRIMAGALDQRLQVSGAGDEFDRLAENLNAMLSRIGALMTGLREVSDNIAHDLKTPLTRLRNRAEEAVRLKAGEEDCRVALGAIIDEADALIGVFDALLLIARAEAGYSSDLMAPLDAGEAARDIVDLYEPLAEERGVAIVAGIEPGLCVRGHRELLGRALVNLIDNALKYGVDGEASQIGVTARRVGENVELAVVDHGPGIPLADRERVTERFVRLDNARNRPGSGLGLSLAAAVARLHHGALRLEDNQPGLRVVLVLPAALRAENEAAATGRA
ncbi:MAG TPA: ATP-binding protein [Methylocystis sp.]|nr:ATP-binding protein [Methylocystis sp.]